MTNFMLNFSLLLNRIALGMYFLLAGAHKIFNVGIQKWYETQFLPMQPEEVPDWFGGIYGRGLPIIELIVGGMLVLGVFGRFAGLAIATMVTSFVIAVMTRAAVDPEFSAPPGPFDKNIILGTLALMILFVGPGMFSIDAILFRKKKQKDDEEPEPERKKRDDVPRRVI